MEAPFHAVPDEEPRSAAARLRYLWSRAAESVPRGVRWAFRRATVAWLLFLFPPAVSFLLLLSSTPEGAALERSPLHALGVLAATLLAGLLGASLSLLYLAVTETYLGEPPTFESHWGGFGGGLAGWRISSSLAYLLGAFFLGGLFGVLTLTGLGSDVVQSWLGVQPAEARATPNAPPDEQEDGQEEEASDGPSVPDGAEDG